MASLSSEPPQWEWATRTLAPTLPPPRPTACNGNTGRARVKGRVRDRAEQKPQPQNQGEIMEIMEDGEKKKQAAKERRCGRKRGNEEGGQNMSLREKKRTWNKMAAFGRWSHEATV